MGRGLRSRKLMNIANRIARGVGTKTVAQPPVFFVVISWSSVDSAGAGDSVDGG